MYPNLEIIGESVRGYLHTLRGTVCQDSYKRRRLPAGLDVICVADGHGASLHPYSDEGSNLACKVIIDVVESYLDRLSLNRFMEFLKENEEGFFKTLEIEWKKAVLNHHKEMDRNQDIKRRDIVRLYGTTLIAALISNKEVTIIQIGDGDVVFSNPSKTIKLHYDDEYLDTTISHSIAEPCAWKHMHMNIYPRKNKPDEVLVLATDGLSNAYACEEVFLDTCDEYRESMNTLGTYRFRASLKTWLEETSIYGSGDDVTVVFIQGV